MSAERSLTWDCDEVWGFDGREDGVQAYTGAWAAQSAADGAETFTVIWEEVSDDCNERLATSIWLRKGPEYHMRHLLGVRLTAWVAHADVTDIAPSGAGGSVLDICDRAGAKQRPGNELGIR